MLRIFGSYRARIHEDNITKHHSTVGLELWTLPSDYFRLPEESDDSDKYDAQYHRWRPGAYWRPDGCGRQTTRPQRPDHRAYSKQTHVCTTTNGGMVLKPPPTASSSNLSELKHIVAQHQPNKYRSKTIQKPSNNRTTTVQQPYNNRTKTVQKPAQQPPAKTSKNARPIRPIAIQNENPLDPKGGAGVHPPPHWTLRYGAAGEAGGLPEGAKGRPHPQDPKGGAGATPRHTAPRRGEVGRCAYPKGRPNPAGPQGRRRRHPSSSCATARRGRPEAYPKGRPYCQKSDPALPEIGPGFEARALTPPRRKRLTASREAGAKKGEAPGQREPPALLRGGFKRARCAGRSIPSGPEALQSPPLFCSYLRHLLILWPASGPGRLHPRLA